MPGIDWSYHRPGCKTCQKAQNFFTAAQIQTVEQIDARRQPLTETAALTLARQVDRIVATRGTRVVVVDVQKDQPGAEALKSVLVGPTGNLRAPTFRVGRTLVVGFHEPSYREVFGLQ